MKLNKRIVSILLAFLLVIGIAIPALAYPQTNSAYLNSYNMHVLTNVISGVESYGQIYSDNRRYDAYAGKGENTSNEKTCTLGWAQNYGGEALKLIQMIYAADKDTFKKLDTCSPSIESMLSKNWVSIGWNPSSSQKAVLIKLITTDVGKNCQDVLFSELMENYLKNAVNYGVSKTNIKALMMWCEISHLGGGNSAKRIFNRCNKNYTMDNIMAALKQDQNDTSSSNQVGDRLFWSRHVCCQTWINQYADDKNASDSVTEQATVTKEDTVVTREKFVEAVRNVYETANDNKYRYGDSHATPPTSDKIISCDRLIAKALWDLGFTDQPVSTKTTSGITVGNIDTYLRRYGFEKSVSSKDVTYGSVVAVGDSGNCTHVFVAVSDVFDGIVVKFDAGSQTRLESAQPFFETWDSARFIACYNIPEDGINDNSNLIKSGKEYLNKYFNAKVTVDGSYNKETKISYAKAIQTVLNEDYGCNLDVDGSIGDITYSALRKVTLGKGSKGRIVTLIEIGLLLNGYDPNGVEEVGSFGDGLLKAVNKFKSDNGITVNNLVGAMTIKALTV